MGGQASTLPGNFDPYTVQLSAPSITNPSVNGTPSKIVLPNAGRNNLLVMNLSSDTIYLGLDGTVSPTNGFVLVPNGGFFKLARWEDFDFTTYGFWAVAANAGGTLMVFEQSKLL